MRFERLREQELFRTPAGWHENPCELGSGFCAKHKTETELPTEASRTRPWRGRVQRLLAFWRFCPGWQKRLILIVEQEMVAFSVNREEPLSNQLVFEFLAPIVLQMKQIHLEFVQTPLDLNLFLHEPFEFDLVQVQSF